MSARDPKVDRTAPAWHGEEAATPAGTKESDSGSKHRAGAFSGPVTGKLCILVVVIDDSSNTLRVDLAAFLEARRPEIRMCFESKQQ